MKGLRLGIAALAAAASLSANAVGRLADVAIFDRSTGRELPVYRHEGRAYVVGKPGNEYKVVIRNRRGEDLLAVVSVDGVNAVSGQTATPDQGGYVVRARQSLDVKGWRKSLGETAAFYFTSLGDSYAGRTGRPDNVGVIGVAFFQRRYEEPPVAIAPESPYSPWSPRREKHSSDSAASPAPAEAQSMPKHGRPSAPLGTGHGRREDSHARYVDFERATDEPSETVAIFYDSYRNLVAMGVIPTYGRPRDPQPFPGFVPDPVRRW